MVLSFTPVGGKDNNKRSWTEEFVLKLLQLPQHREQLQRPAGVLLRLDCGSIASYGTSLRTCTEGALWISQKTRARQALAATNGAVDDH
eukprot:1288854-Rhodomonas_salina.2